MERVWAGATGHRYCHLLARLEQGNGSQTPGSNPFSIVCFPGGRGRRLASLCDSQKGKEKKGTNVGGAPLGGQAVPDMLTSILYHSGLRAGVLSSDGEHEDHEVKPFSQGHIASITE